MTVKLLFNKWNTSSLTFMVKVRNRRVQTKSEFKVKQASILFPEIQNYLFNGRIDPYYETF